MLDFDKSNASKEFRFVTLTQQKYDTFICVSCSSNISINRQNSVSPPCLVLHMVPTERVNRSNYTELELRVEYLYHDKEEQPVQLVRMTHIPLAIVIAVGGE